MKKRLSVLSAVTVALALVFAGNAGADTTLGITSAPTGSDVDDNPCGNDHVIAQATSDPSTPYTVPGPGTITQWQTNVSISTPGEPVTMVVLRPSGSSFTVVAADARALPAAAPADSVAAFPLASPIAVTGGETFGLYTDGGAVVCYFNAGQTPAGNTLADLDEPAFPAPNQTLGRDGGDSPAGFTLNLAANFVPTPAPPAKKKKCKKHKKKRSAESAKKKCKKKKKK
jgi:hypothetical protein